MTYITSIASIQLPQDFEQCPYLACDQKPFPSLAAASSPWRWSLFETPSQRAKWRNDPPCHLTVVIILCFVWALLTVSTVVQSGGVAGGFLCSVVCHARKVFDFLPASSITTVENTKPANTFHNTPSRGMKRWDENTQAQTRRCTGSIRGCGSVHTGVRGIDRAEVWVTVIKKEPGLNLRSCLCPPLLPLAFKASFLQLFLIYTEPEEWVIADQKTGLFCYPIKNTHGDNVLPVPPCDQRGSTNALCFTHLNAHVGVGISKLEVGSHRWYNKLQFFSFILFF